MKNITIYNIIIMHINTIIILMTVYQYNCMDLQPINFTIITHNDYDPCIFKTFTGNNLEFILINKCDSNNLKVISPCKIFSDYQYNYSNYYKYISKSTILIPSNSICGNNCTVYLYLLNDIKDSYTSYIVWLNINNTEKYILIELFIKIYDNSKIYKIYRDIMINNSKIRHDILDIDNLIFSPISFDYNEKIKHVHIPLTNELIILIDDYKKYLN